MSGLAGIYLRDGSAVECGSLGRIADTMAHRGLDGSWVWRQGSLGIAYQSVRRPSPSASISPQPHPLAPELTIAFDGRLDNRRELYDVLVEKRGLCPDGSEAAFVAAAYREFGDDFPARLIGDFALALFDSRFRRLILARDPIGVRPLYYYASATGALLFASEIKALLADPRTAANPDYESVARVMVGAEAASDGETCFGDIRALPPGHLVVQTPDSFSVRAYWDFDPADRAHCTSLSDYTEGFRFYFEQAVSRRMTCDRPVAVAISGGLDSSSILTVADRLHRRRSALFPPVTGFTYSPTDGSPADEHYFLDALSECGPTIVRLPAPLPGSLHAARKVVHQVEMPLLDPLWNATHSVHAAASARGAGTLLTGHWGDQVVGSSAYLIDLFRTFRWTTLYSHIIRRLQWTSDIPPSRHLYRLFSDILRAHVPDIFASTLRHMVPIAGWKDLPRSLRMRVLSGYDSGNQQAARRFESLHARSLYQELRSASTVRCLEWNNKIGASYGLDVAFPFLDRDLLAFVMGIPGDMVNAGGAPKGLLRAALGSALPACISLRRSKADFSHIVNAGAREDLAQARACLTGNARSLAHGLLTPEALRSCLAEIPMTKNDTCLAAWRIQQFVAVELWLDIFLHKAEPREVLHAQLA